MARFPWFKSAPAPTQNTTENDVAPELFARLKRLKDVPVAEAMTPRPLITAVDVDVQLGRMRRLRSTRTPYFLVYRNDLDHILGWVSRTEILDLLESSKQDEGLLAELAQPVSETLDTSPISDLADLFLRAQSPFVVVKNQTHSTVGVVTLPDLVEFIFGFAWPSAEVEEKPRMVPLRQKKVHEL